MPHPTAPLLCALLLAAFAACDPIRSKFSDQAAEQAEAAAQSGEHRTARDLYERALDGTPKSADIHYRLALLCDDKLDDPAGAFYHYGRYLDHQPKGPRAAEVQKLREEVRRELAREVKEGNLAAREIARLKNENQTLRNEATELRARLEKNRGDRTEPKPARPLPPKSGRSYVVQPGDTLAAISRKFYKTSNRWKDIQDANFQQLGDSVSLKPGQTLLIPD